MNAEDIKKTINKIIFTQATTKQWQLLVGKFFFEKASDHDYSTSIIINQWVWGESVCEAAEPLAVIQRDWQPQVSAHTAALS